VKTLQLLHVFAEQRAATNEGSKAPQTPDRCHPRARAQHEHERSTKDMSRIAPRYFSYGFRTSAERIN